MKPAEVIAAMYAAGVHGHSDTFSHDVGEHLREGWVIDTPEFFMMWRTVSKRWGLKRMRTPGRVCPGGDAVWIWAAAGDLRRAVEVAVALSPPSVRWVGYERRGKPRFVELRRFLR